MIPKVLNVYEIGTAMCDLEYLDDPTMEELERWTIRDPPRDDFVQ